MKISAVLIWVFLLSQTSFPLFAQENYTVHWETTAQPIDAKLRKQVAKALPRLADSNNLDKIQQRVEQVLLANGHPLAKAAWSWQPDSALQLLISPGRLMYFGNIEITEPEQSLGVGGKFFQGTYLNDQKFGALLENWLRLQENNGYPFAHARLDAMEISGDSVSATVDLQRGPLRFFDSVEVKGGRLPKSIIQTQLGIKIGKRYNESVLTKSERLTESLPYLEMVRPPQVLFTESKTTVFLYIAPKQRFQFDGLVGLNTLDDGTLTVNGDLNVRLINALKRGEDFRLNWRSPDAGVQQFFTALEVPYWFDTPIWTDIRFKLFRQDSSWANRDFSLDVGYQLGFGTSLLAGYDAMQSSVLGESVSGNGNVRSRYFMTGVAIRQLNDLIVPTRGVRLTARIGQGQRQREGAVLSARSFVGEGEWHKRIKGRHGIAAKVHAAGVWSDDLVLNEMHRLGGFRTLRGFNELSIFAARYGVGSLEYRFFLERYSFLFAFVDSGIIENPLGITPDLTATGLGAGLSFRTGGGMFTFALAMGRTNAQDWDPRLAKVHVGFINGF
jgi:translocation and assembly module TamA